MKLLYVAVAALFVFKPIMAADVYFPKGSVSDFEQTWYAEFLSAMKEPVLTLPTGDKDYFAFRILYLPTWGRPVVLRVERRSGIAMRRAVILSGDGGYDPGEIKAEQRADVTKSEFAALLEGLRKSGFWELPLKDDVIGTDGSQLIVEVVQAGRHAVLVRWTPEADTAKRGLSALVAFYMRLFHETGLWEKK